MTRKLYNLHPSGDRALFGLDHVTAFKNACASCIVFLTCAEDVTHVITEVRVASGTDNVLTPEEQSFVVAGNGAGNHEGREVDRRGGSGNVPGNPTGSCVAALAPQRVEAAVLRNHVPGSTPENKTMVLKRSINVPGSQLIPKKKSSITDAIVKVHSMRTELQGHCLIFCTNKFFKKNCHGKQKERLKHKIPAWSSTYPRCSM